MNAKIIETYFTFDDIILLQIWFAAPLPRNTRWSYCYISCVL